MNAFLHSSRRLVALTGLAFAGLAGSGCTTVQVAPSTLGEYKLGELQVWSTREFDAVYGAAKSAFKELNLFQTQDDRKVVEADLHARDSADTLIIVKIHEVAKGRTSVKIRYGLKGDLARAQQLYQTIERRL